MPHSMSQILMTPLEDSCIKCAKLSDSKRKFDVSIYQVIRLNSQAKRNVLIRGKYSCLKLHVCNTGGKEILSYFSPDEPLLKWPWPGENRDKNFVAD
jgi:hypothetical protein